MSIRHPVNSKAYWNQRFALDWREHGGYEQTGFLADLTLDSLPPALLEFIREKRLRVCDFGCAAGQGVKAWAERLGSTELVEGVDFSPVAIEQGRALFSDLRFQVAEVGTLETYDVVYSSNTLEYCETPLQQLEQLAEKARAFLVLLVPFGTQRSPVAESMVSFGMHSFSLLAGAGKHLVWSKVIETGGRGGWAERQLLLVYASPSVMSLNQLTLAHVRGELLLERELFTATAGWSEGAGPDSSIAALMRELKRMVAETHELRHRLEVARQAREQLEKERQPLAGDLEQSNKELVRLRNELRQARSEVSQLQGKVQKAEAALAAANADFSQQRAQLVEHVNNLNARLATLESENQWMRHTRSWKVTQPLRQVMAFKRRLVSDARSTAQGFVQGAPQSAVPSEAQPAPAAPSAPVVTGAMNELDRIIAQHPSRPILVSRPLVDWNLHLFQRPQHLARTLARDGFLYLYSTPNNKEAYQGYHRIEDGCFVTDRYEQILNMPHKKIFHICSTDMACGDNLVRDIQARGDLILYEYIDEMHPDISGTIPDSAWKRHEMLMADDRKVACVATADKLLREVKEVRSRNYALVTNGVDYDHFAKVNRGGFSTPPKELTAIVARKKPVIGYFGALAKWFDYEMVKHLAVTRPQYEVLLIGLNYDNSINDSGLYDLPNVSVVGPIDYKILPEYACFFDVSTIPFVINDITESTSPIKLFEYMALRRPIVSSRLPECMKYRSALIAENKEDFVAKVERALSLRKDESYLGILDEEAQQNTWESKARDIGKLLRSSFEL